MKKLLSIIVAAAFASASFGVVAQSKDVTDKKGSTVTDKKGGAVTTKDMKDKPKAAPAPRKETPPQEPKKREKGAEIKTKSGGPVTDKKGEKVTGKSK